MLGEPGHFLFYNTEEFLKINASGLMFLYLGTGIRKGKERKTRTNDKKVNQGWLYVSISFPTSFRCHSSNQWSLFPTGALKILYSYHVCPPQYST